MSYLDRDGGLYDRDDPSNVAVVEQQRAATVAGLRETKAVSCTYLTADRGAIHWAVYLEDDEDAMTFLVYALCRAWRDARALFESDEGLNRILRDALDAGVGS